MRADHYMDNFDLSSLRAIATCGEITDISTWKWLEQKFGGGVTPVLDSWWQTETGCPMLNPWPRLGCTLLSSEFRYNCRNRKSSIGAKIPEGKSARPFYGIEVCLVDNEGNESESEGHLCVKHAWPGMARTIYGDHQRYIDTYFTKYPGMSRKLQQVGIIFQF